MAISLINTECKRYGCMKNLLACYVNCRYNTRCEDLKSEIIDKVEQATSDINGYLAERGRRPIAIHIMKRGLKFSEATTPERRPDQKKRSALSVLPSSTKTAAEPKSIARAAKVEESPKTKTQKPAARHKRRAERKAAKNKRTFKSKSVQVKQPETTVKLDKAPNTSYLEKNRLGRSKRNSRKRRPVAGGRESGELAQVVNSSKSQKTRSKNNRRKKVTMPRKAKQTENVNLREQPPEARAKAPEAIGEDNANVKRASARKGKRNSSKTNSSRRNGKLYIILEDKSASLVNEQGLISHLLGNPRTGARYFEAKEVEARVQIVPKS